MRDCFISRGIKTYITYTFKVRLYLRKNTYLEFFTLTSGNSDSALFETSYIHSVKKEQNSKDKDHLLTSI